MSTVNFEFQDCKVMGSSRLSLTELKTFPSAKICEILQRQFLHIADVMRHSDIASSNIVASLLSAAIQDFIENELLQQVESAKKKHPDIPQTFTAMYNFLRALGLMMANQGCSAGIVGLAMSHAGIDVAGTEFSSDTILRNLQAKLEILEDDR